MNPEDIYLQNLRTIERIAAFAARRSHLNADETVEFTQVVCVQLLEDDYAVLRKFEGRSSFATYLHTVILRLVQQWRVEQWGKWRPSSEAKRLGEKAITLERLITRDGFTFDEAVGILTTPAGTCYTVEELEAMYARLPVRSGRPIVVSDDDLPEVIAVTVEADDRVESRDRERSARTCARTIDDVLETMDAEDRFILQLRFWHARKVADIARMLHIEQAKLYKRLDKLYAVLRRALENAGVTRDEIGRLLTHGDQEIQFTLAAAGKIETLRPSHETSGEDGGGGEGGGR